MTPRPLKLYILPTLACDMACSGCYLPAALRVPTRLSPNSLTRVLPLLPANSALIFIGGEPSLLPSGYLESLIALCDQHTEKTFSLSLGLNLMSTPPWLVSLLHSRFGSHVETSFAWSRRHREQESDDSWRTAFLDRLITTIRSHALTSTVFFEVDDHLLQAGAKAAVGVMRRVHDAVGPAVRWDFGPSLDTTRVLSTPTPLLPGIGAPMRVSHQDWERFLAGVATWSNIEGLRGQVVNFDTFGTTTPNPPLAGDGDAALSVSLYPDGSIRAMPLLHGLYPTPLLPPEALTGPLDTLLAQTPYATWWRAHHQARETACAPCPHRQACDGGVFVLKPRDTTACLGAKALRDLAITQHWTRT
jgi:hypothetical protein